MIERQHATWTVLGRVRRAQYADLPAPGVSYATIEIIDGGMIAEEWHQHSSAEDIFVLDGTVEAQLEEPNGRVEKILGPMTRYTIGAETFHRLRTRGGLVEVFLVGPPLPSPAWADEPES